jgi:hypothetical protein
LLDPTQQWAIGARRNRFSAAATAARQAVVVAAAGGADGKRTSKSQALQQQRCTHDSQTSITLSIAAIACRLRDCDFHCVEFLGNNGFGYDR